MASVPTLGRGRPRAGSIGALTVVRWGVPAIYTVVVIIAALEGGLPLSKDVLLLWLGGFIVAFSITSPRRFLRGVVLEWLPLAGVLMLYDLLRGAADGLFFSAFTLPQLDFDEFLFGGVAPTVWLQEHLWHGGAGLRWWDWLSLGVYTTHFFFSLTLAAALWIFAHRRFPRYMAKICLLSLIGLATYALFPAVPPWMAADQGHLPPVTRVIGVVWSHVHVFSFNTLFESGAKYSNDVAAMPSLHAGFAMLVSLTLWKLVPRRVWFLRIPLAIYPLMMGFALVYGAEHYVADILAGYLYAFITYWLVEFVADRWRDHGDAIKGRVQIPALTGRRARPAGLASGSAAGAQLQTSEKAYAGGSSRRRR